MQLLILMMNDWWNNLAQSEQVFWGIALIGSILFLIQFAMSLLGGEITTDADVDFELDDGNASFGADLNILSLRSILAFIAFFGWGGALMQQAGLPLWLSVIFGFTTGLLAMFTAAYMMLWFSKMSEVGNIDLQRVLFKIGEVYLTIPSNNKKGGIVHIHFGGSVREMPARTAGESIPTGAQIRVIRVLNDNELLVEPIANEAFAKKD